MKKRLTVFILILLMLSCAACGQTADEEDEDQQAASGLPPGAAAETDGTAGENASKEQSGTESVKRSKTYDPGIFVIEASGNWRQELAPGYFVNYECELYLDKFDPNDNRSASGIYSGVLWMKNSIDGADFIKDLLKDAPVEMEFAAGGEGICDNLTMNLLDGYERNSFSDYAIPDGQGGGTKAAKEALADEGSFIVVGTQAYLKARAEGVAGETLTHEDGQTGDAEFNYVIQVEPDPDRTATQRKVTIHLSDASGMSATIEGVWSRLPGYRDDMHEYAASEKSAELLRKHLP